MLRTAERPVRNSVLVISRTMPSKRLASTASTAGAVDARRARPPWSAHASDLQQVVAEGGHASARMPGVDDDRGRRLDDRRARRSRRPAGIASNSVDRRSRPAARRGSAQSLAQPRGAGGRSRREPRRGGFGGRTRHSRAVQLRISTARPGSLTANTRSCVAWKLVDEGRDVVRRRRSRRLGSGDLQLPGLVRRSAPRRTQSIARSSPPPGERCANVAAALVEPRRAPRRRSS